MTIRCAELSTDRRHARLVAGGGIVADSEPDSRARRDPGQAPSDARRHRPPVTCERRRGALVRTGAPRARSARCSDSSAHRGRCARPGAWARSVGLLCRRTHPADRSGVVGEGSGDGGVEAPRRRRRWRRGRGARGAGRGRSRRRTTHVAPPSTRRSRRGGGRRRARTRSVPCGVPKSCSKRAAVEARRCGRKEKMPPPSLSTTTMRTSSPRPASAARADESCTSATSPISTAVGAPVAAATPIAVAMTPSMPFAPRLATTAGRRRGSGRTTPGAHRHRRRAPRGSEPAGSPASDGRGRSRLGETGRELLVDHRPSRRRRHAATAPPTGCHVRR